MGTSRPRCRSRVRALVAPVALIALAAASTSACISPRDYEDDPGGSGGGGGGGGGGTTGLYHPAGYVAANAHGLELNMQADDCQSCHGADLTGGTSGVSCDSAGCHSDGWRSDCTYCHGGETPGGAPPRDIDGVSDLAAITFPAHKAHVTAQNHKAFECTQCHKNATDILSPGHVFDDTPGRAEITFAAGLSSAGQYDEMGGCTNLYCHGTGRTPGSSKRDDGAKDCASCHAGASTPGGWLGMSGQHAKHLGKGVACGDCHSGVASGNDTITNPDLHVNGTVEYTMDGTGITQSGAQCTGFCHNKGHFFDSW
jgi:predicted CxxxxCH...CXXCH cytochrome family protein